MHAVDLGIWTHLLSCIAVKYDKVASSHRLLAPAKVNKIWDRLIQRTEMLDPNLCMMKVNRFKGSFLKFKLQEKKDKSAAKKKLEAWEQQLLMLVCFFHGVKNCTGCVQYTFVLFWDVLFVCNVCSAPVLTCNSVLICRHWGPCSRTLSGMKWKKSTA